MVTVVPSEVRENNRDNVGWILLAVVKSLVFECQIGLAVCSSSVLPSKMIVVSHRSFCPKRLVASEAFSCLLMSMKILSSHDY